MSMTVAQYFAARTNLFIDFSYVEDWKRYPVEDDRQYVWYLTGNHVYFAADEGAFDDGTEYYSYEILMDRFLDRSIWTTKSKTYSMILCDTHVDGNKLLCIFDNTKRMEPRDMD